jgi:hypothetical protein
VDSGRDSSVVITDVVGLTSLTRSSNGPLTMAVQDVSTRC